MNRLYLFQSKKYQMRLSFIISLLAIVSISYSQELVLSEIMKGDEFIGHQPENHRWSVDGSTVYFEWNPNNEKGNSTYFWKKGVRSAEKVQPNEIMVSRIRVDAQKEFDMVYYTNHDWYNKPYQTPFEHQL